MTDYISRRAAIKAIDNLPNCYNGYSDTYDKAYIISTLEELPTIDPVKHGEWVLYEFGDETWHKCTACGVADHYGMRHKAFSGEEVIVYAVRNYCPNCGAKMERGEDD